MNELRRHNRDGSESLSTIVVTPDGNYVQPGDYGNNEDMIPDGTEGGKPLSQIVKEGNSAASRRGARYFNNAMERGSVPFRNIAEGIGWFSAPDNYTMMSNGKIYVHEVATNLHQTGSVV